MHPLCVFQHVQMTMECVLDEMTASVHKPQQVSLLDNRRLVPEQGAETQNTYHSGRASCSGQKHTTPFWYAGIHQPPAPQISVGQNIKLTHSGDATQQK